MAQLSGHKQVFHGEIATIDTSLDAKLGCRAIDENGNEFMYLTGVASTLAGSWITYDENHLTSLLIANAVGPVAIAMAAIDATTSFGLYQIFGINTIAKTATIVADSALFIDGTAGQVDDISVIGDLVLGATSMTASSSGIATVYLNYPTVTNDLGGVGQTLTAESVTGDINDSNTTFTVSNTPLYINVNGSIYADGEGIFTSFSGGDTINLSSAVGTGGFIRSYFLA